MKRAVKSTPNSSKQNSIINYFQSKAKKKAAVSSNPGEDGQTSKYFIAASGEAQVFDEAKRSKPSPLSLNYRKKPTEIIDITDNENCTSSSKVLSKSSTAENTLNKGCLRKMAEECGQAVDSNNSSKNCDKRLTNTERTPKNSSAIVPMLNEVAPVTSISDEEEKKPAYTPYYSSNFKLIVNCVMNDEYYCDLFSEEDVKWINTFSHLQDVAQKLYIRLFLRKFMWHRKSKIIYPHIASDLTKILQDLVDDELLMNESSMHELHEVLASLPIPDLRLLAKGFQIGNRGKSLNGDELISAFDKLSKSTGISSFFGQQSRVTESIVTKAKGMLGPCYKLAKDPQNVFQRLFLLFGVHRIRDEDDKNPGNQLYTMLMNETGNAKYPEYDVVRSHHIFKSRADVMALQTAVDLETRMSEALEAKDYATATSLYAQVKDINIFEQLSSELPEFLRSLTATAAYVRVLSYGVDLLQYQKKYSEASEMLQALIDNEFYHLDYRGRWYDRLALNLDFHLKEHHKALTVIQTALNDPRVQAGHRYALWQRADKICNGGNRWLKKSWKSLSDDPMSKVYIEGRLMSRALPGAHAVYLTIDGDSATTRVEDVALDHYRMNGFPEGLHGEGTTFNTLFFIFFWNIVFMSGIADVFYSKYQTFPLDLHSNQFYSARKNAIDERLQQIESMSNEDLCQELENTWNLHEGTICLGLSWELFKDVSHAKGLVCCMGSKVLVGIFSRMAKHLRFVRSGVPDLVIWNPSNKKFKVVEVKGPGDRLSTKQILWLDYLRKINVEAEVCHVKAVGAKRLRVE